MLLHIGTKLHISIQKVVSFGVFVKIFEFWDIFSFEKIRKKGFILCVWSDFGQILASFCGQFLQLCEIKALFFATSFSDLDDPVTE